MRVYALSRDPKMPTRRSSCHSSPRWPAFDGESPHVPPPDCPPYSRDYLLRSRRLHQRHGADDAVPDVRWIDRQRQSLLIDERQGASNRGPGPRPGLVAFPPLFLPSDDELPHLPHGLRDLVGLRSELAERFALRDAPPGAPRDHQFGFGLKDRLM